MSDAWIDAEAAADHLEAEAENVRLRARIETLESALRDLLIYWLTYDSPETP